MAQLNQFQVRHARFLTVAEAKAELNLRVHEETFIEETRINYQVTDSPSILPPNDVNIILLDNGLYLERMLSSASTAVYQLDIPIDARDILTLPDDPDPDLVTTQPLIIEGSLEVSDFIINGGGLGYTVNDIIVMNLSSSEGSPLKLNVDAVSGGTVTAVSIVTNGSNYESSITPITEDYNTGVGVGFSILVNSVSNIVVGNTIAGLGSQSINLGVTEQIFNTAGDTIVPYRNGVEQVKNVDIKWVSPKRFYFVKHLTLNEQIKFSIT